MLKRSLCALAAVLVATAALAADKKPGINISFSSDDDRTHLAPRHDLRDARLAVTTREGSTVLLLTGDAVAVQLSDRALQKLESEEQKDDKNLLEELVLSGVKVMLRKSIEVPVASVRSAEIRNGALVLTTERNQPLFTEIKVNGSEVLRDFAVGDAAKFVNAFRAAKAAQR